MATAVAAAIDHLVQPLVHPSVTPPFILAVAIAALYGGVGPGALASLLSAAALSHWFFHPMPASGAISPSDIYRLLMFLAAAAVVTWIGGMAQRQKITTIHQAQENERVRRLGEEAAAEVDVASRAAADALSRQLETEAGLRRGAEAAARLAAIVASSRDAIIGKTLDGVVTSWNAAAERIFGYTAEEMVGASVFRLIPEELHETERDLLERLRRGEEVEFSEAERIRKDGSQIWISLSVSPILDRSGTIIGAASIKRDITERKLAELTLREHQEQLRLAHEAARLGTWRWEFAGDTLRWDEGLRRLYGLGPDEEVTDYDGFIGRVHPEDRERVSHAVQQVLMGAGTLDHEFRILLPDGSVRWLADQGRIGTDIEGRPVYLTGVSMDVTERKAVEEHLRDTHRLQAVGQLAGGIAHEANNQMSVVLGAAHFLLRRTDMPVTAREDVDQIRRAGERTAAITQQLLAFSRRQILQLRDVDMNTVVQSIEPMLRRTLAEDQHLHVGLGRLENAVRADPRQIEQVLLNLTLNARDAMPHGGRLTITTGEQELTEGSEGAGGPPLGKYVVLVVEDTGRGMEPATLVRAFDPFFTTKSVGQGTGLGLSVVHGIVSQTGGTILADSTPGRGTVFRLYFPVVAPTPDAEVPPVQDPTAPAEGAVALVVEDDPLVRRMAARTLAEAGYGTLEAGNGRAALDLVRRRGGRLDVVITDIGMPQMDGYELARQLEREYPELPVMFISGYGDEDVVKRSVDDASRPMLRKPFSPEVLVRKVGEVLATRPV